eukprot:3546764-Pyramimonas_sp.AAC.1
MRGGLVQRGQGASDRSSSVSRQQTTQGGLKRVKAKATARSGKLMEKSKREAAAVALPLVLEDQTEELLDRPAAQERRSPQAPSEDDSEVDSEVELVERDELKVDSWTLASPYLLFDPPSSSTRKLANRRSSMFAGGAFGYSQRIVIGTLCALVVVGGVVAIDLGIEAAQDWWDHTNLIQRSAPLYMISLLPYLDFLWKLQQSRPQATRAMVFSFAFVLVFVVISTPGKRTRGYTLAMDRPDTGSARTGTDDPVLTVVFAIPSSGTLPIMWVDVKGANVDVKGDNVDVKGTNVDVKGTNVD